MDLLRNTARRTARIASLACVLLAVLLTGCDALEYSPSEENVVEVDPMVTDISIDLTEAPDTIGLWNRVTLHYQLDLGGRETAGIQLFIGNTEVRLDEVTADSLIFNSREIRDGTYRLRLAVVVNAGTGSLADNLGAEVVVSQVERVAIVDNSEPAPVEVTSVGPHEGWLRVTWERSDEFSFEAYRIYEAGEPRATITDRNMTSWVDSTFLVGYTEYNVEVITAKGNVVGPTWRHEPVDLSPLFVERIDGGGKIRLRWQQAPLAGPFERYSLYRAVDDGTHNGSRVLPEIDFEAIDDTVYVESLSPVFGASHQYVVSIRHGADYPYLWTGPPGSIYADPTFRPGMPEHILSTGNYLVWRDQYGEDEQYVEYSADLQEVVRTWPDDIEYDIGVNPSGTRVYGAVDDGVLYEYSAQTMQPVHSWDLRDLLGYEALLARRLVASDAGRLAFMVFEIVAGWRYESRGFVVVDMERQTLVADWRSMPHYTEVVALSPDGQYALIADVSVVPTTYQVCALNDGGPECAGNFVGGAMAFAGDGATFLHVDGSTMQTHDTATARLERTTTLSGASGLPSIDVRKGYLGSVSNTGKEFLVFDMASGSRLATVLVADPEQAFKLKNGVLWNDASQYRPLNLE